MLQHLLCVKVCNEEADIITLYLLPPEDEEVFSPSHHEACEFVAQELLYVICLFDCNGDSDRIYAWLNQDSFSFIPGDDDGVEKKLS